MGPSCSRKAVLASCRMRRRHIGCHYAKEMELWDVGVQANQGQELDQDRPIDLRQV